jgi:hypothetical protein
MRASIEPRASIATADQYLRYCDVPDRIVKAVPHCTQCARREKGGMFVPLRTVFVKDVRGEVSAQSQKHTVAKQCARCEKLWSMFNGQPLLERKKEGVLWCLAEHPTCHTLNTTFGLHCNESLEHLQAKQDVFEVKHTHWTKKPRDAQWYEFDAVSVTAECRRSLESNERKVNLTCVRYKNPNADCGRGPCGECKVEKERAAERRAHAEAQRENFELRFRIAAEAARLERDKLEQAARDARMTAAAEEARLRAIAALARRKAAVEEATRFRLAEGARTYARGTNPLTSHHERERKALEKKRAREKAHLEANGFVYRVRGPRCTACVVDEPTPATAEHATAATTRL